MEHLPENGMQCVPFWTETLSLDHLRSGRKLLAAYTRLEMKKIPDIDLRIGMSAKVLSKTCRNGSVSSKFAGDSTHSELTHR